LSAGGRRVPLEVAVAVGQELRLRLTLRSPLRVEVQVDDGATVIARTHVASDPTLAGIIPRADRPTAALGRVTVTARPVLTVGEEVHEAPELPSPMILSDGRGIAGLVAGQPAPVENLAPGGPLLCGGHPDFYEYWVGGLIPGPDAAALWSPLDVVPAQFSLGGTARLVAQQPDWTVVLTALGRRQERTLQREEPYLALLLQSEGEADARLALAWRSPEERQVVVAPGPIGSWFSYVLSAHPAGDDLAVTVYAGVPGELEAAAEAVITTTVPATCLEGVRHCLALIGTVGKEIRGSGGIFLTATALDATQATAFVQAGYALKMDSWPAQRPTCASAHEASVA
ncbi:MAG: hypothetical protein HUU35_08490, partial [Armatimonadetes bacterium]|nr:hypothetical protein [Armatimonadota bacterium]